MNKFTYTLISLLFLLPLSIMAQGEGITIFENGESQTVTGSVITVSDEEEYIDTADKLYKVSEKNHALLGDLIKNMKIDINDVTTMVDIILANGYSVVADMTKDGKININDVTTAVDVVLGIEEKQFYVESYAVDDITDVWIKDTEAAAVDQQ